MKKATIKLLAKWIWAVFETIAYQTNIFPLLHIQDLLEKTSDLMAALEKE
jgi:hypothetical protein